MILSPPRVSAKIFRQGVHRRMVEIEKTIIRVRINPCLCRLAGKLRIYVILLLSIFQLQVVTHSKKPANTDQWISSVRKAEKRYGEKWSVLVKDLESDETVFSYKPSRKLVPASNRKIIILALALETLGPDFLFKTILYLDQGKQEGLETYRGNLVLYSNGDPTMDASYIRGVRNPINLIGQWCSEIASADIRDIDGDLIIDASAFGENQNVYPSVWDIRHQSLAYAPIPSAITLSRNLLSLIVKPGKDSGDRGRVSVFPSKIGIHLNNRTVTGKRKPYGVTAMFGNDGRTINLNGRVPLGGKQEVAVLPLKNPLEYIAHVLKERLSKEGVRLNGNIRIMLDPENRDPATMQQYVVGTNISPPLHKLLRTMMVRSNNFISEQVWRACAVRAVGRADAPQVRDVEQDWLRRNGLSWIEPGYDGCGLSSLNRNSPAEFVILLKMLYNSVYHDQLVSALPVSGRSGTLKKRYFTRKGGRVHAKTGTLTGVTSLSGLIKDRHSGKFRYVFSIIGNAEGDTHGRLSMRTNQLMKLLIQRLDKSSGRVSRKQDSSGETGTDPSVKKAHPNLKTRLKAWNKHGGNIVDRK